jgi:hypothetical protein
MVELNRIQASQKTGDEHLTDQGKKINYRLIDFWRWSVSDILSNATRGRFAEFIVGTAVGLGLKISRDEWGAYDLKTEEGIKIEVKSAAYIQSWHQKNFSAIMFSIKPSKYWDADSNMQNGEPMRHADVYVFCHLNHKDQLTINPLMMEQWDFYVLPTFRIDNYKRSQSSITLKSLRKLTEPVAYNVLKSEIEIAYQEQETYSKKRESTLDDELQ